MGVSPQTRMALVRAQNEQRARMREMQMRGCVGGPGVPDNASPGDGLLEEYRRTLGIVRWLELKFAEGWTDDSAGTSPLPDLILLEGSEHSMVKMETLFGGWWKIYQEERGHLVKTAKLCLDAGIEERALRIAENQAEMLYKIINTVVGRLGLTGAQLSEVPLLVQAVIRETTVPGELV